MPLVPCLTNSSPSASLYAAAGAGGGGGGTIGPNITVSTITFGIDNALDMSYPSTLYVRNANNINSTVSEFVTATYGNENANIFSVVSPATTDNALLMLQSDTQSRILAVNIGSPANVSTLFLDAGKVQTSSINSQTVFTDQMAANTVVVLPYAPQDLLTNATITGNQSLGTSFTATGYQDGIPGFTLKTISSLSIPSQPASEASMSLNSTFMTIQSKFADGNGGLAAPETVIFQGEVACGLGQNQSVTAVVVGQGRVEITTPLKGDILLNGAVPPDQIVSSIVSNAGNFVGTLAKRLGPGEAVFLTSTFTTTPGWEYRISWTDTVSVPQGTPAYDDNIYYLINGGSVYLEQTPLSVVSTLRNDDGNGLFKSHNYTWVATQADTQLEFHNYTPFCSTVITLNAVQPVRVQELGPVVTLGAARQSLRSQLPISFADAYPTPLPPPSLGAK